MSSITRKNFLAGSALAAVGTITCGTALADEASATTYADTIPWDGAYDVVVVGFGGAGAVAATYAARNGASTLLLDKAPLGHEGGNTRYCGQMFVKADSVENARSYYQALYGEREHDDELLEVWYESIAHMEDKLEALGFDKSTMCDVATLGLGIMSPEYPEFPGAEGISLNSTNGSFGDGNLWHTLRETVVSEENVDVWLSSPAKRLIQDPVSKAVIGVVVEREGKDLNIRAHNGVCLTCGGFENDESMAVDYLKIDCPHISCAGSLYNTGDGIRLAQSVGAKLWHMGLWEGGTPQPLGLRSPGIFAFADASGAMVVVNADGKRFYNETGDSRHCHYDFGGTWLQPRYAERSWVILGQDKRDSCDGDWTEGFISANTIDELAELTAIPADALAGTIERFNAAAASDLEDEQGREAATMAALEPPFWAIEVCPVMINTQGGPQKNKDCQVIDCFGEPIPHLYSAGELGSITANLYQGGGNIGENIVFGEIAGTNAAIPKDPLPAYPAPSVESNLVYVPGFVNDAKE